MFSFLYHFQRLLPELTVYMSNTAGVLSETGTAYPPRALELSPVFFVKSVLLFFVVFCVGRYSYRQSIPVKVFESDRGKKTST
jgi:hypothetical protein